MSASDACLAPDVLLAWVHGKLTDAERVPALAHIEHCAECREALSALAKIATIAPVHETVHDAPRPRPASPLDALGIGARIGRFRILRVLGTGGMGVVVAARDEGLGRDVAIKLVRPDLAGTIDARLVREAQALAALRHDNLVHVLDVGELDGLPYFVMELVDGPNLRRWVDDTSPSWTVALASCIAAGRGLAALHAAGYLHRDVKPDNVLVARDGRVLLADLGLAKRSDVAGENLTRTGVVVGTPRYLAPERIAGEAGDERADIYAFSVMTLELVRACTSDLPPRVQAVLARGADRDPDARFATMTELLAALDRATTKRPRRRWLASIPIAAIALGAGLWVAFSGTAKLVAPPQRASAIAVDAAIVAATDAVVDAPVVAAKVAAPRAATPPSISSPMQTPYVDHLRSLGRGPLSAADAEAAVMAHDRGECKKGANLVLGWDHGKVERREIVDVQHTDGTVAKQLLYQVKGQERRYLFDGSYSTTGYLDVAVGELVLVCPWRDRDDVVTPAGWKGDFIWSAYFGGPIAGPSVVLLARPTYLSDGPHKRGRGFEFAGPVLFLVDELADRVRPDGRLEMDLYDLDVTPEQAKLLAGATIKQPVWVLATFTSLHERGNRSIPILRASLVRRTLFDPK